jgi:peptide/nickel transport system substrate-binding protein
VVFADDFIQRASTGAWQGLLMASWTYGLSDTADLFTCNDPITGSGLVPNSDNNFQGRNYGGWCNEGFDLLRSQALLEFDPGKDKDIFRQMQETWSLEVPAIALYSYVHPFAVRSGLSNFVSSTYVNGYGYVPAQPWLVGWESLGAQKVFDQGKYGTRYGVN